MSHTALNHVHANYNELAEALHTSEAVEHLDKAVAEVVPGAVFDPSCPSGSLVVLCPDFMLGVTPAWCEEECIVSQIMTTEGDMLEPSDEGEHTLPVLTVEAYADWLRGFLRDVAQGRAAAAV